MYKVLLADTDKENIKNFKNFITSSHKTFQVAETLTVHREDIIKVIRKQNIELIIADVRFFGVNSYHLIQDIHKKFPDLRFILYGTLNDIEYLRKSMEFGAIDYMIKPVKPSELTRCLKAAAKYFEVMGQQQKEAQKLMTRYKDSFLIFEMQFLQNLVQGVMTSDNEIRDSMRYFHINLPIPGKYSVVHIRISEFRALVKKITEEEKHLLIFGLLNTVSMSLNEVKHKAFIDRFNAITVIIEGSYGIDELYQFCELIKSNIYNKNTVDVTIGIGRTHPRLSEIHISYNEAVAAVKHKFYMGINTIIPFEFVEPDNSITFRYPIWKENRLVQAAVNGEFEYCAKLLQELFTALRKASPLPDLLLSQIIIDILISIGRYAKEQNKIISDNLSQFFPIGEAMKINQIDEGYTYLYNTLKQFCEFVTEERKKADEQLVNRAKEYLKARYYESISLNNAALKLSTTPEYLNQLFVELEDKSYFEYAVHLRMDIAKRFMRETDLNDDVIAVNIGYDDGKYFNGVFKQFENMSTDEYRAQLYK